MLWQWFTKTVILTFTPYLSASEALLFYVCTIEVADKDTSLFYWTIQHLWSLQQQKLSLYRYFSNISNCQIRSINTHHGVCLILARLIQNCLLILTQTVVLYWHWSIQLKLWIDIQNICRQVYWHVECIFLLFVWKSKNGCKHSFFLLSAMCFD